MNQYNYFIKSPARRDIKFIKLSLTTKLPITYTELIDIHYQYALDNQRGRNQVIIECRAASGMVILRYNPYNFDENIL